MGFVSASILAQKKGIERDELSSFFMRKGYITIENNQWKLTEVGLKIGAKYSQTKDGQKFIVWPEEMIIDTTSIDENKKPAELKDGSHILVSKIAEKYGLEPTKVNMILSEIGWIDKDPILGWRTTAFGKNLGAIEKEHLPNGVHFVIWPKEILENKILISVLESFKSQIAIESESTKNKKTEERINKFRQDLPGTYRTKDGHWVRSRAEVIIDDALYYYEVPHAYERKIPVEEEIYSDFYLPQVKVYIEFWGLENDEKYAQRKKEKISIYQKYNLDLIELNDIHIMNLDDHLPRYLLQYGIRVI